MGWRGMVGGLASRALQAVPLEVWETIAPRPALPLCYHLVSGHEVPHVQGLFAFKTPDQFTDDVAHLVRRREIVSDKDLVARLQGAGGRRRPAVAISFDDGLAECHSVVRPILNRAGARAIFFVTTGCIDNRAMIYRHQAALCIHRLRTVEPARRSSALGALSRRLGTALEKEEDLVRFVLGLRSDRAGLLGEICGQLGVDVQRYLAERAPYLTVRQIRELAADGHGIGAHSVTHRDFGLLGPEEIETEVVESCETVAAITGRAPVPFALPFSLEGIDRALLLRIARAHPRVGWFYGTSGLKREPVGVLNRVVADSPRGAAKSVSNLPRLLREAYASCAREAARGFLVAPKRPECT